MCTRDTRENITTSITISFALPLLNERGLLRRGGGGQDDGMPQGRCLLELTVPHRGIEVVSGEITGSKTCANSERYRIVETPHDNSHTETE